MDDPNLMYQKASGRATMAMGGPSAFQLGGYAAPQRAREMQAARDVTQYVSSAEQSPEERLKMGQLAQQQAAAMAGNNPLAARQALINATQPALQIGSQAAQERMGDIQQARQQQLAAFLRQKEYENALSAEELKRRGMQQQFAQQYAQQEFEKQQQQAQLQQQGIMGGLGALSGIAGGIGRMLRETAATSASATTGNHGRS